MTNCRFRRFATTYRLVVWGVIGCLLSNGLLLAQSSDALKIIVIDGEDAVNIVKKKTAVQPIVEVRDQNNLPVAGAAVIFLLPSSGPGGTFLNGSKSLNVTTNALGRASATNFSAVGAGAFTIVVSASFRGSEGRAKISQTNYLTAAAAAATAAGVGDAVAAGGAGAGVAGLSTGALAAVVGAVAIPIGLTTAYAADALGCMSPCK
jgi:hypothetical protein